MIREFEAELSRCQQPGYRSRYDDDFADAGEDVDTALIDPPHASPSPSKQRKSSEQEEKRVGGNDTEFGAGIF